MTHRGILPWHDECGDEFARFPLGHHQVFAGLGLDLGTTGGVVRPLEGRPAQLLSLRTTRLLRLEQLGPAGQQLVGADPPELCPHRCQKRPLTVTCAYSYSDIAELPSLAAVGGKVQSFER